MARLARLVNREKPFHGPKPLPKSGDVPVEVLDQIHLRLDPRPDLKEDHRDWLAVLVMCRHDKQLFGLLHGLRCGGARLEVRQGKRGPYYRIDYEPLLDAWDKDELLREWLEPNRVRIKMALERGLQAKKTVELQIEQEAARAKRRAAREPEQVGLRF